MRTKSIQSLLWKKFDEWMNSIKDESVKKLVKENTIITGGCIVSLLNTEYVNDYDVYFTNIETAYAVACYYVDEFKKNQRILNGEEDDEPDGTDLRVELTDNRIRVIVQSKGIATESDNSGINFDDIEDPATLEAFKNTANVIKAEYDSSKDDTLGKYRPVFISSNAITLSNSIQIVTRFFGPVEEVHKNFDFVHCTNYWLSADKKLYLNKEALESIVTKQLKYVGSLYPLATLVRIKKFIKRGWDISAGEILKIAFQISKLNLEDISVLEEQLVGVDAAFFRMLIETIKTEVAKNPNFVLDYNYLVEIIDKIF